MLQDKPKKPVPPKDRERLHIEASFEEVIQMFADAANEKPPVKPKTTKK